MIARYIPMKTAILLIITALISGSEINAQSYFPTFSGEDLNGKMVTLPAGVKGSKCLLGFTFSQKSQADLESWAQPVFDELIDPNSLASMVYDAKVYLVIVFNKTNVKLKKKVTKELHKNILPEFYGNILLTEAESKNIRSALNIETKDVPTLLTLNKTGEVTSRTTGRYSMKKLEKLTEHLEIDE